MLYQVSYEWKGNSYPGAVTFLSLGWDFSLSPSQRRGKWIGSEDVKKNLQEHLPKINLHEMTFPLNLVYIMSLHLILTVLGRWNHINEKTLKVEFTKDEEKRSWRQVLEIRFGYLALQWESLRQCHKYGVL